MILDKKLNLNCSCTESQDCSENNVSIDESCGIEVGCGPYKNKRCPVYFCQCFASTRWALVFLSLGALVQGFIVNGHTPVVISTLERRFELTSTESGLIASCYDIAGSITVLVVTYFGGHGHKPLWIGWGMLLIGISGIVFSFPHFTAPHFEFTDPINVCGNASQELCSISVLKNFRFVFYGALLLAGAGAAPLYSLSITYIDENVMQRYSSFYNGILIAMSIVGPGVGFLVGAAFLKEYTYPTEAIELEESSEHWVGAWWIGSLICGLIGVVIAIPVLMLPRVIPGTKEHRMDREKETHQHSMESSHDQDFAKKINDFPKCVLILLRNPTFVFLSLGIAVDSILINGMATFGAKYIETQFGVDASNAGTYFGLIAIVGGAGGQLVGGGLISRYNFNVNQMMHMCYIAPILAALASGGYLITCSNPTIAGVTSSYQQNHSPLLNITSGCNLNCDCSEGIYNPVCGSDRVTYYSPCFAGCTEKQSDGIYANCSCIAKTNVNATGGYVSGLATATTGSCSDDQCSSSWQFIFFCFLNFILMFVTFFNGASALQVSLRCVGFNQRSFSVGVQILITRILGTIPGPLVVGAIFDGSCLQWTNECGVKGSCLAYSNSSLSLYVFLLLVIAKGVDVVLFLSAKLLYKPAASNSSTKSTFFTAKEEKLTSQSAENVKTTTNTHKSPVSEQPTAILSQSNPSEETRPETIHKKKETHDNPTFIADPHTESARKHI